MHKNVVKKIRAAKGQTIFRNISPYFEIFRIFCMIILIFRTSIKVYNLEVVFRLVPRFATLLTKFLDRILKNN